MATLFFMLCDMISSTTNKATDKNDLDYDILHINTIYPEEFDRAGIYFRQKWIDERA